MKTLFFSEFMFERNEAEMVTVKMYLDKNLKNMFVCFCLNSLALKNLVDPSNGLGQVGQQWGCQHLGLDIRLF